uniref:Uncharacterized protein n=1 Tax=Arundo donax TaxID=35708 RepID=A0A0A9G9X5_ARUDO
MAASWGRSSWRRSTTRISVASASSTTRSLARSLLLLPYACEPL